jgi:hypothetical protein
MTTPPIVPIDPEMPFLNEALSPTRVAPALAEALQCPVVVRAAHLLRHKRGRRALIEYEVRRPDGSVERLLGKARAKGVDHRTFELQSALFHSSFAEDADDRMSVPEPLAIVPELRMWLQRKVFGVPLTDLLSSKLGPELCARAARVVHKLHAAGPKPPRAHAVDDELRILSDRLSLTAAAQPALADEIRSVLAGCERLAARLRAPQLTAIHRDFYPDQVLVRGDRMYLLDLDLYCLGDPNLDAGNFLAHLLEHALRHPDDASECDARASAFRLELLSLDRALKPGAIEIWTTLSLARHIHLSTQFAARRHLTQNLLELTQRRLNQAL